MKKQIIFALVIMLFLSMAGMTFAGDNPLRAEEKKVNASFAALIPADKIIGVDQFYQVYQDVMSGKKKAYMIDVRTYPEFDAFHIEGTDHISFRPDVHHSQKNKGPERGNLYLVSYIPPS